jgi:hypothetical protein
MALPAEGLPRSPSQKTTTNHRFSHRVRADVVYVLLIEYVEKPRSGLNANLLVRWAYGRTLQDGR